MRRFYDRSLGRIGTARRTSALGPTRRATGSQSFRRLVGWWTGGMALALGTPRSAGLARLEPKEPSMIRTIAAALAVFALVSFGARCEDKPAADAKAPAQQA